MSHLNYCNFIGRIANDPELRSTKNGTSVTTFSLAIPRSNKNQPADFIEVTCWKNAAEFVAKYCAKGDQVTVSGELQQQRWEDAQGNKRSKHFINFATVHDSKRSKNNSSEYGEGGNTFTEIYDDSNDGELPF